jgi:hypothetical protein
MGNEFEMYEITAFTLMRNDARAKCFSSNLQELQQRARTLPSNPHWYKTARDVVRVYRLRQRMRPCVQVLKSNDDRRAGCCVECRSGDVQGSF